MRYHKLKIELESMQMTDTMRPEGATLVIGITVNGDHYGKLFDCSRIADPTAIRNCVAETIVEALSKRRDFELT